MGLNSCLFEIKIMHDRRSPVHYRFTHTVFMFYIDLDEIDLVVHKTCLFGHNQSRVYNFCEQDHIGGVRDLLISKGVNDQVKKIRLLTNMRTFGYIFNPVSFYYCFDAQGEALCVIVEIGNTFRELKYFFLGPEKRLEQKFNDHQVKYYYISPFTVLDNVLDFEIQVPDENLKIGIDVIKDGKKFLYSSMLGKRLELNTKNLLINTFKYPFLTLKVIFLIHWHAAVLHFKKHLPHHRKEDDPQLQKDAVKARV